MNQAVLIEELEGRQMLSGFVVSMEGSDAADGSAASPWRTLQRAAESVKAGDTVTVRTGRYAGFSLSRSGEADAGITFSASPMVVIDRPSGTGRDGINLEGASWVTIEGFNVVGMPRAGIRAVNDEHVTVRNNTVDKNGVWGIFTGFSNDLVIEGNVASRSVKEHGIYVSNSCVNPAVVGNEVWGNRMCGIHMNGDLSEGGTGLITGALVEGNRIHDNGSGGGSGINCDGVQNSRIQNNLLYANHSSGISLYRICGAKGSNNNIVVNNTIVQAMDARWALNIQDGSTGNVAVNNILLNLNRGRGAVSISKESMEGFVSDFNIVTDCFTQDGDNYADLAKWQRLTGLEMHSTVASPGDVFVDYRNDDYRLRLGSPALEAGSATHAPVKDVTATTRPAGKNADIGAYGRKAAKVEKGATFSGWWIAAGVALAAVLGMVWRRVKLRGVGGWMVSYAVQRSKRRWWTREEKTHVLLCIADHFEPENGEVSRAVARERVARWEEEYPKLMGGFRDSDGRPPRHSFFYPMETYRREDLEAVGRLCGQGFGEVEIHLHHSGDTAENLWRCMERYKEILVREHGMLSVSRTTGEVAYGFIHGDWALDNSHPQGRDCGVNNELDVLRETGCYADFTLPSYPSPTQTSKINSIYYAVDDPERPKSHDWGVDVGVRPRPRNSLMLIQGPLVLNWGRRKWGVVPRVENGCIQGNQAPSMERLDLWMKARVQVRRRPDWYFVKLHTHGAPEANSAVLLGEAMVKFHADLARRRKRDSGFEYHYVTAREMYNLARAAEAGWNGTVEGARDFVLVPWSERRPVVVDGSGEIVSLQSR